MISSSGAKRAKSLLALAKECQEGVLDEASSKLVKFNRDMSVLLTQLRDTAIARSGESTFILSKLWDMAEDRVIAIRNRGKDLS